MAGSLRSAVVGAWGEPQRDVAAHAIDLGNVLIAIQPPRGWGENPVAVYHSPDLPPLHDYLGFYRWLDVEWGADAIEFHDNNFFVSVKSPVEYPDSSWTVNL